MQLLNKYVGIVLLAFIASACAGSKEVRNISFGEMPSLEVSKANKQAQDKSIFHEAIKQNVLGNYDKAAELLESILKKDKQNTTALFMLGKIYAMEFKDLPRAIDLMEQADAADHSDQYDIDRFLVKLYIESANFTAAINGLKELITVFSKEENLVSELAFCYDKIGKTNEAVEAINLLENTIGSSRELSLMRVYYLISGQQYERAITELELLVEKNPSEEFYVEKLAEIYAYQGNMDKVVSTYSEFLEKNPEKSDVKLKIAQLLIEQDKKSEAQPYLTQAFQDKNISIDVKIKFLISLIENGDQAELQQAKNLALELPEQYPNESKCFAVLGDIFFNLGDPNQALPYYEKAVELDKTVYPVWRQLLFLYQEQGKWETLKNSSESSLDYFPNQTLTYLLKGIAEMSLEEFRNAQFSFEKVVIRGNPNKAIVAEAWSALGDLHHRNENYTESDSCYDKALDINPDNAYVLNNYAYYLSLRADNLEKAMEMAMRCNELMPGIASFQDTYGYILYLNGKFSEAEYWLAQALKNGGNERPVILEHYGDVQFELGNIEEAKSYWQKALDRNPNQLSLQEKLKQ